MNIIDIIYNNQFVKSLYPNGIDQFSLTHVKFDSFTNLEFIIQIRQKPVIEIQKWGKWNENFNIVSLTLTSNTLKKIDVDNWTNAEFVNCSYDIEVCESKENNNINDLYKITFRGENWSVTAFLINLIYQKSHSYIVE